MRRATRVALLLLLFVVPAFATGPTFAHTQAASVVNAPSHQTGGQRFLTLPFTDSRILVQQGFIYSWGTQHSGIDYILGNRNDGRWQSFDVVAAADGWACVNCTARQGNAVWIKHLINGVTYYTYYGHLASWDPSIPVGNQQQTVWVQRGQKIGVSGATGVAQGAIHLHFQVTDAHSQPIDPYDLWTTREPYAPGCTDCQMGPSALWTTNPPSMASGVPDGNPAPPPAVAPPAPQATRPPAPTATNTPVPTPTQVPCTLDYGKTVTGSITNAAPAVQYCVRGTAGDSISVRMFAAEGSHLDTVLKLYDPSGRLIASDDDGAQVDSNSFLVQKLTVTGTYKLEATRFSGSGQFHLRMDRGAQGGLGDLNGDCLINGTDVQMLIDYLNARDLRGDLNLDGVVDSKDQQIQVYHLGRGCVAPAR